MNESIDYEFYSKFPVFTAELAGCLWCDIDPNERYGSLPLNVQNMVLIFSQEIGHHVHWKGITRKELLRLADHLDVQPYFLFFQHNQDD